MLDTTLPTAPTYPVDAAHRAPLVSLAGALVAALLSEDAETAFVQETREFVDQLGDTLTLPISAVINLDQLDRQERRELLEATLNDLGLSLADLDWDSHPELALDFQHRIWAHLYQRFLNSHQVVSSHIEMLPRPAADFPRPLHAPAGSWLLLYAESGSCLLSHADGDIALGPDTPSIILLPPESEVVLHRNRAADGCSLFSSAFFPRQSWLSLLPAAQVDTPPGVVAIDDRRIAGYLTESFGRIIDIAHSRSRQSRALHLNLLEHILLLCDELTPREETTQLDRRVSTARDFLLAHYREKTTVEQVASAAGAAPSTLTALFKHQMGENMMRWRDQLRMQRAKELLQDSELPIKAIAAEVGYDDPMFFSRRFKQLTGWSPTQIRTGKTS